MRLVPQIVTAATGYGIDLVAAKKFADVQHSDDDGDIDGFIATAFEFLQPPQGCLRKSIVPHTLRLDLPCWPVSGLELPAGPVTSIVSITYYDTDNAQQTLSGSLYFADNDALMFTDTFAAPSLYSRPSAVQITYIAGLSALPALVRTAMLQMVKHWYDNRDAVAAVGALNMMPLGVDDLIFNLRQR